MPIRLFESSDAPALAALFHAAVHRLAARDYTPHQRGAWSPAAPDPARYLARAADGRRLLVAVDDDDTPLAYGDLERDGHIDHFYCHPDHAGTGLTIALYDALERIARDEAIAMLYVEASEPARRFFLRRGFVEEARRDFDIAGVPIHNYRMTKNL
ncbi:MAG: GNAT family N-acetyltransferase [Sphingomonas sp. 28-66-16]|nr:MAG: GNAT family N-acetyltransferase [Sphingomonas sp. 28-66-16]